MSCLANLLILPEVVLCHLRLLLLSLYLLLTYGPMLAICALAATPLGKRFYEKIGTRLGPRALTVVDCGGLACVLVMAAAYLVSGSYNPFLYFRF